MTKRIGIPTEKTVMSTYAKLLDDGRYEYGCVVKATDRRKDRLEPVGIAPNFEEAMRAIGTISGAT